MGTKLAAANPGFRVRRSAFRAVAFLLAAAPAGTGAAAPAGAGEGTKILPDLVTSTSESRAQKALQYLARSQSGDGSYRNMGPMGSYPTTMTALAGMAFLASGSTAVEGPHADKVRKCVDYLLKQVHTSGLISAANEEGRSMYGHGFSVLFLANVIGSGGDPALEKKIKDALHKAILLTEKAQSPRGGWYYGPENHSDEGSVTVTQLQALRACRNAGLKVPKKVIDGGVKYIENSVTPEGGISYQAGGGGGSRPPITAAAVACLYSAGQYESPIAKRALDYCVRTITVGGGGGGAGGHYFYSHLYFSQACYQAGDKYWKKYFPEMRDQLVRTQNADGSWMENSVGPVFGTAVATIILHLPYSYLPLYQR